MIKLKAYLLPVKYGFRLDEAFATEINDNRFLLKLKAQNLHANCFKVYFNFNGFNLKVTRLSL